MLGKPVGPGQLDCGDERVWLDAAVVGRIGTFETGQCPLI